MYRAHMARKPAGCSIAAAVGGMSSSRTETSGAGSTEREEVGRGGAADGAQWQNAHQASNVQKIQFRKELSRIGNSIHRQVRELWVLPDEVPVAWRRGGPGSWGRVDRSEGQ